MKVLAFFLLSICLPALAQTSGNPIYGTFSPKMGQKYVVSGWVNEDFSQQQASYSHSEIEISFLLNSNTGQFPSNNYHLTPSGPIIDGWQRIAGIIEIPQTANANDEISILISLNNNNTNINAYFDDVRFYPYNGNLKSFVYDEDTNKVLAELDENNYATFYEYDQEGGLIRIKKETEKGVFTIQEGREKQYRKKDE